MPLDLPDPPEQRIRVHGAVTEPTESEIVHRFSSLHRLLCVTAWCRQWLGVLPSQRPTSVAGTALTAHDLEEGQLG